MAGPRWGNRTPLPHRQALATTALGVAALHACLLLAWPQGPEPQSGSAGATPMRVRQVILAATSDPAGLARPQASDGANVAASPGAAVAAQDAGPREQRGALPRAVVAAPTTPAADAHPAPGAAVPPAAAARDPSSLPPLVADVDSAPAPIYATRPPASATLHFELRRGAATGSAVLDWRHDAARYELALVGTIAGVEALGWIGRGGFDEAGLAPERFVVRRRGRDLLAANFQRGASRDEPAAGGSPGRVTFSGPAVEWPLWPGVQDRVSWLLQLASILEAEPGLAREGAQVVLRVVGARGDAGRWTLEARAPEALDLPAGRIDRALPFVREAQRAHDLRVEVWVDPERGHLPVRLRFTARPSGDVTEFLLGPTPPR